MKNTNCYLCKGETRYLFEKDKRFHVKCTSCGLIYVDPISDSKESAKEYYSDLRIITSQEAYDKKGHKKLTKKMKYRLRILENYCDSEKKLLDIGFDRGDFICTAENSGWECTGIELSKTACDYLKEKSNARIINAELLDINFPENYFNAITLWHMLEHYINPLAELKEIYRILKPRGILCLEVPNIDSLSFKFLSKHWKYINREHNFYFNIKTISMFLEIFKFRLLYATVLTNFLWWDNYKSFKELIHKCFTEIGTGDHLIIIARKTE